MKLFITKERKKYELALKIDMNKAYDRVEWNFLREVLLKMEFADVWFKQIMGCVESMKYNINLFGKKLANITVGRGVRQGDPLPPYMFIIVVKVPSNMVRNNVLKNDITFFFLGDDPVFFLRTAKKSCETLRSIFEAHSNASGQQAKLNKSGFFSYKRTK